MKKPIIRLHLFFSVFLLAGLMISVPATAHELKGPDGNSTHKHVYKANSFGKGAAEGHYAQPAGSNGIVIWQSSANRSYAKSQPGFKVPGANNTQASKKAVFTKEQRKAPDLNRK